MQSYIDHTRDVIKNLKDNYNLKVILVYVPSPAEAEQCPEYLKTLASDPLESALCNLIFVRLKDS